MANPVTWFEVNGPEPEQTGKFYSELFGWHTEWMPEVEYVLVDTHAGTGINGGLGKSQDGQPQVTVYVQSEDLQGDLDKAESLGGKTVMPPTDMNNVSFAMLSEPQGSTFGLYKMTQS